MLIKLARDQVEIIETRKEENDEDNTDVDIGCDSGMDRILHELRLQCHDRVKLEEPDDEQHFDERTLCESKVNIEHTKFKIEDFEEDKLNTDDIVLENLNESASEIEAEDNEDADANWEPWDKKNATKYNQGSHGSDSDDAFEDELKPVPKGNSKTNKFNKQQTSVIKHEHQCNLCEARFSHKCSLVKHLNANHLNKFQCSLCGQRLSSSVNLRKHMFKNHDQLFLACPICKEEFTSKDISNHISQAHAQSTHVCPTCMKVYTSELYLKSHLNVCRSKTVITSVKCEACFKLFSSKMALEGHLKVHMGVIYTCEQCGKTFSHKRTLYRHRDREHLGIVFRCEPCNKTFADDRGFRKHNGFVHGSKKRSTYECDTCPKTYARKTDLDDHIRSVHYGLKYTCSICDRTWTTRSGLRKHQNKHQFMKNTRVKLSCELCGKSYAGKREMVDHLQCKHYGLKYTCPLCDKTFNHKSAFQRHERKHNLNQFNCQRCKKTFSSRTSAATHLKLCCKRVGSVLIGSQLSRQRYGCAHCALSFARKSHLQSHIHGYHCLRVDLGQSMDCTR